MAVDPVASLRVWAVELELGSGAHHHIFQVPAMPAADWLPLLIDGDMFAIIDLIPDHDRIDDLLLSDEIQAGELAAGLTAVIEQVCGRPLHSALALAQLAHQLWWIVGGELARAGFRWDQQPIAAALDAIDRTAMVTLKKEFADRVRAIVDSETSTPGRGTSRRPVNRAAARAAFQDMAGPPPTGSLPSAKAGSPAIGERYAGGPPRTRRRLQQPHPVDPSGEPMPPPGQPADSGPAASHVGHGDAHGPASDSGSPPPPPAR